MKTLFNLYNEEMKFSVISKRLDQSTTIGRRLYSETTATSQSL